LEENFWFKLLKTLILVSFSIFFGISIARSVIFYDLYSLNESTGQLELRTEFSPGIQYRSMFLFFALSAYTSVSYLAFFVFSILYCALNYKKLKYEGWLFMNLVLLVLISFYEFYVIYRDIIVSLGIFYDKINNINSPIIKNYMEFKSSGNVSILSGLSFIAQINIFIFLVFKPLRRIENKKNQD